MKRKGRGEKGKSGGRKGGRKREKNTENMRLEEARRIRI